MAELPGFIEKLTGHPIRSKTDDGAVLELMDAFGLLSSPNAATRDYDAEGAAMRDQSSERSTNTPFSAASEQSQRRCDSCESKPATHFSPAHNAHFCTDCHERETARLSKESESQ